MQEMKDLNRLTTIHEEKKQQRLIRRVTINTRKSQMGL